MDNPEHQVDLEAIHGLGNHMRELVDSGPDEVDQEIYETWRDGVLHQLGGLSEQVPYPELHAVYNKTYDQQIAANETLNEGTKEFEAEQIILAASKSVAARHSAELRKRAEQLEKSKQDEAKKRLEEIKATAAKAAEEHREVADAVEAVSVAWPVPFETLEAVHELRQIGDMDEQLASSIGGEGSGNSLQETEEEELGPFVGLSEQFTPLEIKQHISRHIHVYDHEDDGIDFVSAKSIFDSAEMKYKNGEKLSLEEDSLRTIVGLWRERYLESPHDLRFLQVFAFKDIVDIHKRLMKFSRQDRSDRPDFGDLELRILSTAVSRRPLGGRHERGLMEAVDRMDKNNVGRSGLTWYNLNKQAARACDILETWISSGGRDTHLSKYKIEVKDRQATKVDMSWVLQFIVDDAIVDAIGVREQTAQTLIKERFVENMGTIDKWFEDNQALLDQVPKDFRFEQYIPKSMKRFRRGPNVKKYEAVSAVFSLRQLRADLQKRLDGTGVGPRQKAYDFDPRAALNHQIVLVHKVAELQRGLRTYGSKPDLVVEDIVPLT